MSQLPITPSVQRLESQPLASNAAEANRLQSAPAHAAGAVPFLQALQETLEGTPGPEQAWFSLLQTEEMTPAALEAGRILPNRTGQEGKGLPLLESMTLQQAAQIIADRLNASKAPCAVLIPLKGWSSLDREGGPLYDPDANRIFAETLKQKLNSNVPVVEVDLHLNTPEFGKEAVDLFHQIFTSNLKPPPAD